MEKTQSGHSRTRNQNTPETLGEVIAPLGVNYLTPKEFAVFSAREKGKILGAIAFGVQNPLSSAPNFPFAWINMPLLSGGAVFEVWTSDKVVIRENGNGIASSRNDDFLFGCLEVDEGDNIDAASYLAYCRIFDFIEHQGYRHLLRVWNYFPRINNETGGLERYRSFSIGRHDAFMTKGRDIGRENVPAACALGTLGGPLVIYFIAAKNPGHPVENPRQTSAYYYPPQYGPRSPTFSRATYMHTTDESLLFISGTASIVGHATLHVGDAPAQAKETTTNIRAVIEQASLSGWAQSSRKDSFLVKAYLRDPEYLPIVQDQLQTALGPTAKAVYLQADICRSDLLLEVEGVCLNNTGR